MGSGKDTKFWLGGQFTVSRRWHFGVTCEPVTQPYLSGCVWFQ